MRPRASKKRSAGTSSPERTTVFVDRSLGKQVAVALAALNIAEVIAHHEHFADDSVQDEEWLAEIGGRGWIALLKDQKVRYRPLETRAISRHGVKAFIFTAGNLGGTDMCRILCLALPRMIRFARVNDGPFVVTVARSGKLSRKPLVEPR